MKAHMPVDGESAEGDGGEITSTTTTTNSPLAGSGTSPVSIIDGQRADVEKRTPDGDVNGKGKVEEEDVPPDGGYGWVCVACVSLSCYPYHDDRYRLRLQYPVYLMLREEENNETNADAENSTGGEILYRHSSSMLIPGASIPLMAFSSLTTWPIITILTPPRSSSLLLAVYPSLRLFSSPPWLHTPLACTALALPSSLASLSKPWP